MIVLDTHIWLWWVDDSPRLTASLNQIIADHQSQGLGISIFSCWEVAKLVEKGRLTLNCSVDQWLDLALAYPGVQLLNLTLPIVLQANKLIDFHNDPADQIIVATALVHDCFLLTVDNKIVNYPYVRVLK